MVLLNRVVGLAGQNHCDSLYCTTIIENDLKKQSENLLVHSPFSSHLYYGITHGEVAI